MTNKANNFTPRVGQKYWTIGINGKVEERINHATKEDWLNIIYSLCWDSIMIGHDEFVNGQNTIINIRFINTKKEV